MGILLRILLFAEHRALMADLDEAAIIARLRAAAPERKLAVEVTTLEIALAYARGGVDVLQLEKFPRKQCHRSSPCLPPYPAGH